ncbi:NADPH-dependent F420 reductase [Demequina aurantiaca]|uniref:NADPH-dependent F420 reductase n=1 Tax=Demequina aurantiaca TaxID=676200 RepID=UPI000783FD71|nr:NAD(P)-binding domain-containing protein [Demequina aurantiaca]
MTTIGIIGAGNIGSNVAKAAIANGYEVVISNSRGPETLGDLIDELGSKATAATAEDAAEAGDFVVVAVPLKNYREVPVGPLAGKLVIDANNYYFERDGRIEALDNNETTTSQMLQEHLPESQVVKAFNNIPAKDIPTDGAPAGSDNRRALPIAGDIAEAKARVAALLDEFGFDAVDVGPLEDSWRVERDRPAYVVRSNADELRDRIAEAVR